MNTGNNMRTVTDHGWPVASDGNDANAFDAFKNERDYVAGGGKAKTTVAAMDWAAREIERLRAALEEIHAMPITPDDSLSTAWLVADRALRPPR